jgi:predicted nuclease of predicted toxin-antitoxin system
LKILLDENFPLQLYRRLLLSGCEVEHIIMLGQRGLPDAAIRGRISKEEIVFFTQDSEFEKMSADQQGIVLISRIRQSLPIQKRTEIWFSAIEKFMAEKPAGKLFELLETGEVVAWEVHYESE